MLKHKVMIEGNMKGMARLSLLSLTIAVLLAAAATAKAVSSIGRLYHRSVASRLGRTDTYV